MKLKELLAISEFDTYSIYIRDEDGKTVKFIDVSRATAPDYPGPFYSKSHRENQKANKKALKEYADCEVEKLRSHFNSNPYITCIMH